MVTLQMPRTGWDDVLTPLLFRVYVPNEDDLDIIVYI
jgi:hypothetical protein